MLLSLLLFAMLQPSWHKHVKYRGRRRRSLCLQAGSTEGGTVAQHQISGNKSYYGGVAARSTSGNGALGSRTWSRASSQAETYISKNRRGCYNVGRGGDWGRAGPKGLRARMDLPSKDMNEYEIQSGEKARVTTPMPMVLLCNWDGNATRKYLLANCRFPRRGNHYPPIDWAIQLGGSLRALAKRRDSRRIMQHRFNGIKTLIPGRTAQR